MEMQAGATYIKIAGIYKHYALHVSEPLFTRSCQQESI
jgi:hypothetical protein